MINGLEERILLIFSHTFQFSYPLTKEEIILRFIGNMNGISETELNNSLLKLLANGKLFFTNGFYHLDKNGDSVKTRINRIKYSKEKWQEVDSFVSKVKLMPSVLGILVTGSLALDNVTKNDDIDFFIITENNRLWITRLIISIFALFNGKKRSWHGRFQNTWCLNMWLERSQIELPDRLRNIYGSFEVAQAVWVYDKKNVKKDFFTFNSWAKNYLPNYYEFQRNNNSRFFNTNLNDSNDLSSSSDRGVVDVKFKNNFLNLLNSLAYYIQKVYMIPHITREKVGKSFAFFHPRDTKKIILGKWYRKYIELTAQNTI